MECTITGSDVFMTAAERHSAFGRTSSVTKRHTKKEKDLNVPILGVRSLDTCSRVKIILRGT